MSHRSVPAPFLTKTYQLVDDRSTDNVVSWNEKGTAFVVWKMDDFSKDLLPAYFKHNNFSSFVRQLNTYGFHKTVPDKWEFSNDNFKRGHKNLLTQIRRRKSITSPSPTQDGVKSCGVAAVSRPKSPSISGECLGSGSISTSSSSKNPASVQTSNTGKFDEIVKENEKLKMENEKLSSELAQTKKELDKLIVVLSQHATVGPSEVMSLVSSPDVHVHDDDMECLVVEKNECEDDDDDDDDDNDNVKNGECARVKLFGVWLKENKKKRGGDKISDFCGPAKKSYGGPWKNLVGHPNKPNQTKHTQYIPHGAGSGEGGMYADHAPTFYGREAVSVETPGALCN